MIVSVVEIMLLTDHKQIVENPLFYGEKQHTFYQCSITYVSLLWDGNCAMACMNILNVYIGFLLEWNKPIV